MLKVRFPLALPFAVLASLAACSSSSTEETGDAGKTDTGTTTHSSSTTVVTSSGTSSVKSTGSNSSISSVSSSVSTSSSTPTDGGTPDATTMTTAPVVPAGATAIATNGTHTQNFIQVIGLTSDDYIVYYDATGGISAAPVTGSPIVIAPGPTTDGGLGPSCVGLGGNIVAVLTDYTTYSDDGNTLPIQGTLSIWSATQTNKTLVKVTTQATGIVNIASDSSYVAYMDGVATTLTAPATVGNIGVVSGSGTGAIDLLTSVGVDQSSTTVAPFAIFDKGYLVVSAAPVTKNDAGVEKTAALETITSFNSASTPAWTSVVLTTQGSATSSPFVAPGTVNFTTDTAGDNVVITNTVPTDGGTTTELTIQGIASATQTKLFEPFTAPAMGEQFFYLAPDSSLALFTEPTGALGKATFTPPSDTPTITTSFVTAANGPVLGVQVVSSDSNYDVDYNTAINSSTGTPTSLFLRSTATGAAFQLVNNALGSTFGGVNGFTADNAYVIFTSDLKAVGSEASTGTLATAPVTTVAATPTGAVNQIVTNQSVWNANPLTGKAILYNQNYFPSTVSSTLPNGAATADYYVVNADGTGPGTLVVSGADAPDYFYITSDKTHMFFSFTDLQNTDGGIGTYPTDGIYSIAIPAAP